MSKNAPFQSVSSLTESTFKKNLDFKCGEQAIFLVKNPLEVTAT